MMNTPTGMSILHKEGANNGGVLTTTDPVMPVPCKIGAVYLNPLQALKGNRISNKPAIKTQQNSEPQPGPLNLKKKRVVPESQTASLNIKKKKQVFPEFQTTPLNLKKKKQVVPELQTTPLDLIKKCCCAIE